MSNMCASPTWQKSDGDDVEKEEMCNTDDSFKRQQSDNEDVDKEEMCNTDDSFKRQQSDNEDVDKEEMCNTDDSFKRQQSDNEDVDKEEMCNTDDSFKRRQSDSEDVDKEEMCNTDDSFKRRQSDSEDVDKEDMSNIGASIKRQHSDDDDVEKEEMCNTDDSFKRRQSDSEDVDKEDMSNNCASIKRQYSDDDDVEKEGATVTIKKRKQEIDEASAETQETGAAEVGTQTDAHEFILNAREPMIHQLKLTWTSNVDYQHQICDTLSTVDITRSPDANPTTIYVYNTDGHHRGNIVFEKIPNQLLQGKVLLYHGTDEFSAKNIIERGIDITRSTRSADFSHENGFYVTKDYGNALEWSKIMVQRSRDRAAVIVFKIDTSELHRATHLSLNVDNETNMTWWQCIVSHFRHGKRSSDVARVLRDVKYIEGPMSADSGQEIPTPAASGIPTQLCICDQEFAETFGSLANIMCVVFLKL